MPALVAGIHVLRRPCSKKGVDGRDIGVLSHAYAPASRARCPRSVPERTLVAPAITDRLIGNTGMIGAIGQVIRGVATAEEKVGATWIANRPAASLFRQLKQGLALLERNFDQFRLWLDVVVIGEGGVAAYRWAWHPHHVAR